MPTPLPVQSWVSKQPRQPRRRNSDDTESESETEAVDPSDPWRAEWNLFLRTHEIVPEGMSIYLVGGMSIFSFVLHFNAAERTPVSNLGKFGA
jgi:hypothetical protein